MKLTKEAKELIDRFFENKTKEELEYIIQKYSHNKQLMLGGVMYSLACDKINQAKQTCISNYCRNGGGVLWESLWKYEEGKIMQKTCCSGLFNNWYTFEDEDSALKSMIQELETIEKVRVAG